MSTAHTFVKVTLRERLYEKTGHIALYLDYYPPIRNPKTMKQTLATTPPTPKKEISHS